MWESEKLFHKIDYLDNRKLYNRGSNVLYILCFSASMPNLTAFEKSGLKIEFSFERVTNQPSLVNITMTATNSNPAPLTDFVFQAAVPKVWLF